MNRWEPWAYSDKADVRAGQTDLVGCDVEATDGHIGKVDQATYDVGSSYVVVDTGPWIFGRKVLLPAGTIENVDVQNRKIYVDRTKDEIKNSPPFDADRFTDPAYRTQVGDYYGRYYPNP
jgi:hypothetical protein